MITLTVNGLNKLQKIAEQFPAVSEKYINLAISRSLVRVLGEEKVQAPFGVSGLLRDNWQVATGRFQGSLTSMTPYAIFVHEGTAPHMPPVDAITPWANKKGINPWALAKSIAKNGTKANPFLQRSVDNTEAAINTEFETAMQSTLTEVTAFDDTI